MMTVIATIRNFSLSTYNFKWKTVFCNTEIQKILLPVTDITVLFQIKKIKVYTFIVIQVLHRTYDRPSPFLVD
jgi:hypothetical protein